MTAMTFDTKIQGIRKSDAGGFMIRTEFASGDQQARFLSAFSFGRDATNLYIGKRVVVTINTNKSEVADIDTNSEVVELRVIERINSDLRIQAEGHTRDGRLLMVEFGCEIDQTKSLQVGGHVVVTIEIKDEADAVAA
jgi:hypothetical protein